MTHYFRNNLFRFPGNIFGGRFSHEFLKMINFVLVRQSNYFKLVKILFDMETTSPVLKLYIKQAYEFIVHVSSLVKQ